MKIRVAMMQMKIQVGEKSQKKLVAFCCFAQMVLDKGFYMWVYFQNYLAGCKICFKRMDKAKFLNLYK